MQTAYKFLLFPVVLLCEFESVLLRALEPLEHHRQVVQRRRLALVLPSHLLQLVQ